MQGINKKCNKYGKMNHFSNVCKATSIKAVQAEPVDTGVLSPLENLARRQRAWFTQTAHSRWRPQVCSVLLIILCIRLFQNNIF